MIFLISFTESGTISVLDILALIASMVAIVAFISYWAYPRLQFCVFIEDNYWKVKVVNSNFLKTRIVNIQCEVALSRDINFQTANTINLVKDRTLILKAGHNNNYIFKPTNTIVHIMKEGEYKLIRVRFMCPNFIGVLKVREKFFIINDIPINACDAF